MLVSKAINDVPTAMLSVFRALGTIQFEMGDEKYVVYAKGGLCLVLAARAVTACIGNCPDKKEIEDFLDEEMMTGVLSPSDVDTTVMERCNGNDEGKLKGIGGDKVLTAVSQKAIDVLNSALSVNGDFWKALKDIISSAKKSFEVSPDSRDVNVSLCDKNGRLEKDLVYAKIESHESSVGPLLRSLNSSLQAIAGFTLIRSKLLLYEDCFYDCEENAPVDETADNDGDQFYDAKDFFDAEPPVLNAAAEILDISWKDSNYGCEMETSDVMQLRVEPSTDAVHPVYMMTIPAIVRDLLYCLLSNPGQKSTKRVFRLAFACCLSDDDLSKAVKEFLESPTRSLVPEAFKKAYDIQETTKPAFLGTINAIPKEQLQRYIDHGNLTYECMNKNNTGCLSNGLIFDLSGGKPSAKPIPVASTGFGGGSGVADATRWGTLLSATAAVTVAVAASFAGALRSA